MSAPRSRNSRSRRFTGDEISRVNGIRYARAVIAATVRYRMHQVGMLCDLRYRRLDTGRYEEKTYMSYSSHALAMEEVERVKPARLMDIGCGPGFIARHWYGTGNRSDGARRVAAAPRYDGAASGSRIWRQIQRRPM